MRIASAPEAAASTLFRYQLDVIAASASDVVRAAGGWLFDRAMAGWDVNLLIADPSDKRPLRILGIRPCALGSVESVFESPRAQAIAVAAEVFNSDARVRENVVMALKRGLTEVTLWGDTWPPDFYGAEAVRHRLSPAARAFKAEALAAAGLAAASITTTETFRSGSRWYPAYQPAYEPDLLAGGGLRA